MITWNGIFFVFLHFSFPKRPTHFIVFLAQLLLSLFFQRPVISLHCRTKEGSIHSARNFYSFVYFHMACFCCCCYECPANRKSHILHHTEVVLTFLSLSVFLFFGTLDLRGRAWAVFQTYNL